MMYSILAFCFFAAVGYSGEEIKKLMPKTIAILVEDMYQVLEVWYPVLRLKEDGVS